MQASCAISHWARPRIRSSVRIGRHRLYSTSRGRSLFCPTQDLAPAGRRLRPARGVQPGGPRLVRGDVRRADPAQAEGWAAIAAGHHTLIHAPTGSGKTLAAFLWCLDRLVRDPTPPATREHPGTSASLRLAAQGADLRRRAQPPGAARRDRARRRPPRRGRPGDHGRRSGPATRRAEDRRDLARRPPDILITTPEIALPDARRARRARVLRGVEHVIVDEVHAIAGTKRGAHLALSLERLERLRAGRRPAAPADRPVGDAAPARDDRPLPRRASGRAARSGSSTRARASRSSCQVVVPVEDMGRLGEALPLDEQPGGPAAGPEARVEHLAGDPPADPRAHPGRTARRSSSEQPPAGRAAGPAAQRAGRRGARPGPPRLDRPRAAGRDRGGAQGRPAAGDRRHVAASSSGSTWARSTS